MSNYLSNGVSQTEDNPAMQVAIDYRFDSAWYTGIWVSNVDYVPQGQPNDGTDFEVDLYLGYSVDLMEGLALDMARLKRAQALREQAVRNASVAIRR